MHDRSRTVSRRLGGGSSLAFLVACLVSISVQPSAAQLCPASPGTGNPCVLTGQYNNHRDGYNNNEIALTSQAVTTTSVTQVLVDGSGHTMLAVDSNDLPRLGSGTNSYMAVANPIYSQPLYLPGMSVASPANTTNCPTTCDMVISSTLNGTLFAWNADNGKGLWARYGACGSSSSCDQSGLPNKVGNAFWQDDCNPLGSSPGPGVMAGGPLQFLGNLSTGVIDTTYVPSSTTAVMYVTSYCQYTNSSGSPATASFLHEVDLKTGLDVSYGGALQKVQVNPTANCAYYSGIPVSGCISGQITFSTYGSQIQRPALLEVSSSNVTPHHVIYVPFGGYGMPPTDTNGPYHGWMVAYTTDSNGVIQSPNLQFNTSTYGPASGNTATPICQSTEAWPGPGGGTFQQIANRCGFWASFWQSGRGPAATNYGDLGDNAIDIFAGTSDGTFQTNGHNSGGLLRFQLASSGVAQNPYQWFSTFGDPQWQPSSTAPTYGTQICGPAVSGITQSSGYFNSLGYAPPCNPPIQPPQVNSACMVTPPGGGSAVPGFCPYTFEVENNNDWDPSISGETLFYNGIDSRWEIVTINKDGMAYVLNPGDFCNGGSGCISGTGYAFSQHDPGVLFSFIAPEVPCWMVVNGDGQVVTRGPGPQVPDCDHANTMAFFNYLDSTSGDTNYLLYYWPNDQQDGGNERLTALQMDQLAEPWNLHEVGSIGTSPTQSANTDGTTDLQASGSGVTTLFTQEVIPGDQIVCSCTTPNCPVVAQVISDTQLTLSQPLPTSCISSSSTIYYAGHFINPRRDMYPNPNTTGYPGGSMVIAGCQTTAASAPTCESSGMLVNSDSAVVWAISTADTSREGTESGTDVRTQGQLHAYAAKPTSTPTLQQLWATANCTNCQTWCASSFALPTVANGQVFVPTYALNLDTTGACPDVDHSASYSYQSGLWVAGLN